MAGVQTNAHSISTSVMIQFTDQKCDTEPTEFKYIFH